MYEHSYGLYSSGVLSRTFGLQFAVSSTVPPATNELIMTMDSSTGVAIAHSLDISNNLQVQGTSTFTGNVSAPNLYTQTETNHRLANYALQVDLLLNANSADVYTQTQIDNMLNTKQNSLTFHDNSLNYQYSLLNGSTVKSLENGGDIVITPSSTYLIIDLASSVTIDYLNLEQITSTNSAISTLGNWSGVKLKLWSSASATNSYWIGIESLNMTFHTDGNFRWRCQLTEIMSLSSSGNLTINGSLSSSSDARLKTYVQDIDRI